MNGILHCLLGIERVEFFAFTRVFDLLNKKRFPHQSPGKKKNKMAQKVEDYSKTIALLAKVIFTWILFKFNTTLDTFRSQPYLRSIHRAVQGNQIPYILKRNEIIINICNIIAS